MAAPQTPATNAGNLCVLCRDLTSTTASLEALFSGSGYDHHNRDDLRRSAASGCPLCKMLDDGIGNDTYEDTWDTQIPVFAYKRNASEDTNLAADGAPDITHLVWNHNQYSSIAMSVFAFPGKLTNLDAALTVILTKKGDAAADHVSQRPRVNDLGDKSYFDTARDWLKDCKACHTCSVDTQFPILPYRVIDVDPQHNDHVRLRTSAKGDRGEYVAMSYCWGKPRFLTTTRSNLDQMQKPVPLSTLPKTFVDAISATRAMGFRYVWIDALCIVQDDNDDKAREIGRMNDIYKSASLTITAASSTGVSGGFLAKTESAPYVDIPYLCLNGSTPPVRLSVQATVNLVDEATSSRAWCLQESVLSPRNLIYTRLGPVWQCRTTTFRTTPDTHVNYEPPVYPQRRSPLHIMKVPKVLFTNQSSCNRDQGKSRPLVHMELWSAMVEEYTRRVMTVQTDKLPALAGVAVEVQRFFNDQYLAGLWRSVFVECLAWKRCFPLQPDRKPVEGYRAPTWSWAAVDDAVEYKQTILALDDNRHKASLISAMVEPLSADVPLGQIKHAEVRMAAFMMPAADRPSSATIYRQYLDLDLSARPSQGSMSSSAGGQAGQQILVDVGADLQLMLLGEKDRELIGLVVLPVPGMDMTFRRVGMWECSDRVMSKAFKLWDEKRRVEFTIV